MCDITAAISGSFLLESIHQVQSKTGVVTDNKILQVHGVISIMFLFRYTVCLEEDLLTILLDLCNVL